MEVAAASIESYVVTEAGEAAQETSEVFAEAGIQLEQYTEDNDEVVYQEVEAGQDLVSLAMETSKVMQETVQEQEMVDEEYPDEIECQLIQKSVFIGGQVQTIDFIMCNQCPRLFRTENLLWNHIKAKHKRRSYRKFGNSPSPGNYDQFRRHSGSGRSQVPGELEPGEIDRPVMSPPANGSSSPVKSEMIQKDGVFIVGLEKNGHMRQSKPQISPEKLLKQKTRKRIYVDSNQGPFKCPGCDNVTFSNRRSLELHMKRLHKAGIVECDECGRKVLDLKRHKEILHK